MNLPDDILIVGLGMTGVATARFLSQMGKRITIVDEKSEKDLGASLQALEGVSFVGRFGPHRKEDFMGHSLIVLSPGVDSQHPMVREAKEKGARVIGEMELACRFIRDPMIAITGTNGKTTVTTLVGEIFRAGFGNVFVGGNIGKPLIQYLMQEEKASRVIVEVSSFQLETIEAFRPNTAVLLNVADDHLDRYRSFDEYRTAKQRIFENQQETDWAVLNADLSFVPKIRARIVYFSSRKELSEGSFIKDGMMTVRLHGREYRYERSLSPLTGVHNTENLLAALLVAHLHQIDEGVIREAITRFKGLPHRIEVVRTIGGVTFYNDSKATNVDATKRALESIDGKVVLIAGGKDKGGSYKRIADEMGKVRALILFGEAKQKIRDELSAYTDIFIENDLSKAVQRSLLLAREGDAVLFSPMCSSFDMFKDYKDRGNRFKTMVESL